MPLDMRWVEESQMYTRDSAVSGILILKVTKGEEDRRQEKGIRKMHSFYNPESIFLFSM